MPPAHSAECVVSVKGTKTFLRETIVSAVILKILITGIAWAPANQNVHRQ